MFDLTEAQQLTAEEQVEKWVDGRKKILWDSKKRRNEALDCFVYALAALRIGISRWQLDLQCAAGKLQEEDGAATDGQLQITPVPYPERMNDATGRTCRCPCGTA
ncbi:terminase gpA endonuclease subunit [Escherichia coli]